MEVDVEGCGSVVAGGISEFLGAGEAIRGLLAQCSVRRR